MTTRRGIYWFYNDFRLHDNPLLSKAAREVDSLHCVYFPELKSQFERRFLPIEINDDARQHFAMQSIGELNQSLRQVGQVLHKLEADGLSEALDVLNELIRTYNITDLFVAHSASWYLDTIVEQLEGQHPKLAIHRYDTQSLFRESELPFDLEDLPQSFSKFRKLIEKQPIPLPSETVTTLPPPVNNRQGLPEAYGSFEGALDLGENVRGGELAGLAHVRSYFETDAALYYKKTRNALDDWQSSTKFSLWLANGNISAKAIVSQLHRFERHDGANDSTYWIVFELLWREYFHWYGRRHGARLFAFSGIQNKSPLTSFYAQRFRQWVNGTTPFPIVNACMRQLKQTGYMSNRGRQLVASCLVHELSIDWRYGANYFQHTLIDYDVGSNWGNWQYLAGVGADPRGHRKFDLQKQTQMYDPDGVFIRKWQGEGLTMSVDAVDMVDWPIDTNE
ncbi:DASH family cryptochrome [Vibrio maritimus]|uniref:DASH family cryptochrome n=1 Tax=Vibrio maritimus TaxID=990268 RepID=UPI004069166E